MAAAEALARGLDGDRVEPTSSRATPKAPAYQAALGYAAVSGRQARYVQPF